MLSSKNFRLALSATAAVAVSTLFVACGGGETSGGGSGGTIYYPYETVYGDTCRTSEPTPGCTFNADNGTRVRVSQDPDYDRYGYDSDDLWFVEFDSSGRGSVYNDLGQLQYTRDVSQFAGYISGTTIGVGTTGSFWENVANGTYWLGQNGVLYNANSGEGNFGEAINNDGASDASDTSFAALETEVNKNLVKKGAAKLVKEYGFKQDKAMAVASALNSWAVAGAERGFVTTKDMDTTFKATFGVDYRSAIAAVNSLKGGDTSGMRNMTDRSASALGLKPHQAQKFIKGMYKQALAEWGYNADSISW